MNAAPAFALRPRSAIEIIDVAVEVMRRHFIALFSLAAAVLVPAVALEAIANATEEPGLGTIAVIASVVLDTIASGAVVAYVGSRVTGPGISTADALRQAVRRFWPLFGGTVVYGALILLGLLLLVVPGIILAARYFAITTVIMLENQGVAGAGTRSSELTKGSTGRVVGIFGTAWVVYIVAMLGVEIAAQGFANPGAQVLVTGVIQAALNPFLATLTTLLYFDLRVRREGYDVVSMLEAG